MSLALLAVVAGLVIGALRRPRVALAVVLGTLVLVPGVLPLPGGPGVLTIHRVVVLAALVGLVRRCRRGELSWEVLRPPPIAYRFALVLGILGVIGVGLLQPGTSPGSASRSWQALAAQLLVLVVVVALARAANEEGAGVAALVVVTCAGAGIAMVEHLTGQSYARAWFHAVPKLLDQVQAEPLATRGGNVRVRVAGDFTLAYAWTTAAVVPLVVVLAARSAGVRRYLLMAAIPLVLLAVGFTYSRSVAVPVLLAVAVAVIAARDRSLAIAAGAAVLLAVIFVIAEPSTLDNFRTAADRGSIDVRVQRLPVVTSLAAAHPYTGLGLSGLAERGFPAADSTYLLGYAETGALGVAALCGLLLAGCGAALRGALGKVASGGRAVPIAAGTGAVVMLAGAVSFDAFTTATSAEVFWVLVALGVVAAERLPERARAPQLGLARAGIAVTAVAAIGVLLRVLAPAHVAQTWQFDTLRPFLATTDAPQFTGVQLRTTACQLVHIDLTARGHAGFTCQALGEAPGQGVLRLQAGTTATLTALRDREVQLIQRVPTLDRFELRPMGVAKRGIPTALRTAPVSLPIFAAIVLLPVPRRRRPAGA